MPEDRRHAAIMFTDIVGYTALMGRDEDAAFDMLANNHTLHEALIEKHNGTLIKEIGDGTLASFPLASNAVRCAIDIQKEAKNQKIPLKIGIHEGEMVMAGSDILGDSVNIASRLQESAEEGCINISGSVYSNIRNKADIQTTLIGEKSYKNVGEPIKVYSVLCEGELKKEPKQVWESKKARNKNPYYIIGSFLALIIVLISIWFFSTRQQAIVKESEIEKSIAVLPFKNLSTDVENQYFADGIMDGILNHLSKIKDLRVVSRSSTEKYRENIPQAQQIIKELDVSYYIEGSVFKSEDRILMTAKLLDARNDEHIWSEQYDRELSDLFEVMSEIATKVASEVKVIITPEEKQIIESIPTTNLTAYDFFLRAREEHSKFWLEGDKKALDDATSLYYRALEYDSSFAQAYTGLAFSYGNKLQIEAYFEENFLDSVLILSNKALSFNEYLEEAYYLRSGYLGFIKNELDSAILEINKAIQINPNYAPAYLLKGMLYIANSKDYSQAISNFHKGLGGEDHLFGKQAAFDQLSRAYLEIGFIEKSVFYAKESLKLSTDSSGYLGLLASIQYLQGDFEECSRFYKLDYDY